MKEIVAVIPKNPREEIRVELTELYGKYYLDVRQWTVDGERTERGITVSVAMLPALLKALEDTLVMARSLGLL